MDFVTPVGFRDVMSDEALAREELTSAVRALFARNGYRPVETPTLEVLDVMEAGGHVPASPFKFFDSHGDLLAMRPDVTMQIARMAATRVSDHSAPIKLRYTQRVFREAAAEGTARELTQLGVESIGTAGAAADAELVRLFAQALRECGLRSFKIALGSARVLRDLLACSGASEDWRRQVLSAYHTSNYVLLDQLIAQGEAVPEVAQAIDSLPDLRGGRESIAAVRALVAPLSCDAGLDELEAVYDALAAEGLADNLLIDFSVVSSLDYYTGIVFEAFAPGLGSSLGGGGRYDDLLTRYGAPGIPAAGFAFYLEQVMAALAVPDGAEGKPLRIAVPKGSLNADAVALLEQAGLDVEGLADAGRTLMLRNGDVEYIIVRPSDAPVFVALGAADCGICGEDSLVEQQTDVVELVDLRFGGCRFIVAESEGTSEAVAERYRKLGSIRVATKYPNITRWHFGKVGMQVEIMPLHGNIELAPITGMAERIVDITATGTTLRENNLVVVEDVLESTARFFANPCSFRTDSRVGSLARTLMRCVEGNDVTVTAGGATGKGVARPMAAHAAGADGGEGGRAEDAARANEGSIEGEKR